MDLKSDLVCFANLKLEVVGPGRCDVLVVFVLSAETPPLLWLVVVVRIGVVHCLDDHKFESNIGVLLDVVHKGILIPGVVDGGDGDPPHQQLQASLAGFGRIHRGAEQKPGQK